MVDVELPQDAPEIWDWEVVQNDWWKTSFRAISWAYKTKPGHPRPPHYHDLLARGRRRRITADAQNAAAGALADLSLNTGLCGVQTAEDALRRYEAEVAINPAVPSPHIADDVSEPVCEKAVWDEKVKELLGGILEDGSLPEIDILPSDVPLWDLDDLDCPVSSSTDPAPPPCTPKPSKATLSYAGAVSGIVTASPVVVSPLPSRILSKDALDFIPATPCRPASRQPTTPPLTSSSRSSDSPYTSPTYNFHFPSLTSESPTDRKEARSLPNPDTQKQQMQVDPEGFWFDAAAESTPAVTQSLNPTRIGTPRRPSAALLPSFLTDGSPTSRSRNSKTREIVDRLRSSGSAGGNRKSKKGSRRHASGKDTSDMSALGPEASTKNEDSSDGWISTVGKVQTSPSPPSHPKHPKHGHKRSSGSGSTSTSTSPASSTSTFSPASSTVSLMPQTPATASTQLPPIPQMYSPSAMAYPPFGASHYGTANPNAFMQMPYSSPRAPWGMGYQPGMYPMYQSFGLMPAAPYGMVPVLPLQPAFYDGKGKPPSSALIQWYVPLQLCMLPSRV